MSKITVLGAGGFGIALAILAHSNSHTVAIWSPFEAEVESLKTTRTNERLLKGVYLPEAITVTSDINIAENDDITVIAVPSFAVRQTAVRLKSVNSSSVIANVAKGFEKDTLLRLTEVLEQVLPERPIVALTGPSHAEEVARNMPTAIAAVSKDLSAAALVQQALSNENMRLYTNSDVIGAELGGALKNVIAICVGFCNGLGLGDNTRAALITRGLAEMSRLGTAMGADPLTFSGLTGIGDLVVTCMSQHSRNNRFGTLVGSGVPVKEALDTVGTVEGYFAAQTALKIAEKYGVELSIISECCKVLYEDKSPAQVVKELMLRPLKSE